MIEIDWTEVMNALRWLRWGVLLMRTAGFIWIALHRGWESRRGSGH